MSFDVRRKLPVPLFNRATGYAIRNNLFAGAHKQLVEICSSLTNPDGSASMPRMDGNVFAGTSTTRLGTVGQLPSAAARPTYVPLDDKAESYLNARGGGNRVIVR